MEEERQKFFVFEARGKVFDPRVVEKELAVMIDVIEVFATFLVGLTLHVRDGARMVVRERG